MLDKIYLEITNVCNLDCSFCHKTARQKKLLTEQEFNILTDKLQGRAKFLYFHLMGEPTLHPLLPKFIDIARQKGFLPMLTTNGSLLSKCGGELLSHLPYKISISLHAPEANPTFADEGYLDVCIDFAKQAARGCIVALRLWNLGTDSDNSAVLTRLHAEFTGEWGEVRGGSSLRLAPKLFLEWGEHFDWPDRSAPECSPDTDVFCYGLRDQIGVLCDGTCVPCCLDAEGDLALGNLFDLELDEILSSPRARAIYEGFSHRRACESLCRKCGYAKRFGRG
ncbi:MAG: SPASM domain-containing protein [Clostridia bacterium]|nr:SPASM domain-containing protein [Clostridia bacterium]